MGALCWILVFSVGIECFAYSTVPSLTYCVDVRAQQVSVICIASILTRLGVNVRG